MNIKFFVLTAPNREVIKSFSYYYPKNLPGCAVIPIASKNLVSKLLIDLIRRNESEDYICVFDDVSYIPPNFKERLNTLELDKVQNAPIILLSAENGSFPPKAVTDNLVHGLFDYARGGVLFDMHHADELIDYLKLERNKDKNMSDLVTSYNHYRESTTYAVIDSLVAARAGDSMFGADLDEDSFKGIVSYTQDGTSEVDSKLTGKYTAIPPLHLGKEDAAVVQPPKDVIPVINLPKVGPFYLVLTIAMTGVDCDDKYHDAFAKITLYGSNLSIQDIDVVMLPKGYTFVKPPIDYIEIRNSKLYFGRKEGIRIMTDTQVIEVKGIFIKHDYTGPDIFR